MQQSLLSISPDGRDDWSISGTLAREDPFHEPANTPPM
jgi:hypothetical protein